MQTFFSFILIPVLALGALAAPAPAPEPGRPEGDAIVERYVSAAQGQNGRLNGAKMEVAIDAEVPKLKKRGSLHGLRTISQFGKITYDMLKFEGDRSIKNEVIGRYLSAESEAKDGQRGSLDVTPANYKFKYKGTLDHWGRPAHRFEVSPRKKRVGLYKGELIVDAETFLPLREAGKFVKSPSIFLKSVEFEREYEIRNGVAVPTKMHSSVNTRIVGKAELTVAYQAVSLAPIPSTLDVIPAVDNQ